MAKENPLYEDDEVSISYVPEIDGHTVYFKGSDRSYDFGHDILRELAVNFEGICGNGNSREQITDSEEYLFHKFDLINPQISGECMKLKEVAYGLGKKLVKAHREETRRFENWCKQQSQQ